MRAGGEGVGGGVWCWRGVFGDLENVELGDLLVGGLVGVFVLFVCFVFSVCGIEDERGREWGGRAY